MAKQELAPSNNDRDIGVIESDAREAYEDAVYMAQSEWSKRDRVIQATYLDAVQDNLHQYQTDVLAAQRAYRDATSGILWAQLPLDDLKSERRNALSINARRALDALTCEHFEHAQKENGNLSLTYDQFELLLSPRQIASCPTRQPGPRRCLLTSRSGWHRGYRTPRHSPRKTIKASSMLRKWTGILFDQKGVQKVIDRLIAIKGLLPEETLPKEDTDTRIIIG